MEKHKDIYITTFQTKMKEIKKTIYNFAFEDINTEEIYLLSTDEAVEIWKTNIDKNDFHFFKLKNENWLINNEGIVIDQNYVIDFNDEYGVRVSSLLENLHWNDLQKIFFCLNSDLIICTSWKTFKQNWINFLYVYDDSPIILRVDENSYKEALVFEVTGAIYQIKG
jgi:hypothetical protein